MVLFQEDFRFPDDKTSLDVAKQNAEQAYAWIGGGARELADLIGQLLALKG